MAAKPTKKVAAKPVAKKTSVKPKASATSKPSVRGGPGAAGKNVSKQTRNPTSSDKQYNSYKKELEKARGTYKSLKSAQMEDPLGRALTGGFGKYDKKFKELDKVFTKLNSKDQYWTNSGYKSQMGNKKQKKK